jgi:CubicO group peptidase (beta-lactamase class C family)
MTSGYDAVGNTYDDYDGSRDPFTPAAPLFTPPGSKFTYFDDAMNELGYVLTQIAGEPLYNLFMRKIGVPIGIIAGAGQETSCSARAG